MKASEANKLSKENIEENKEREFKIIMQCIENKAIEGKFMVETYGLHIENKERLLKLGYKVDNMPSVLREGTEFWTISWGDTIVADPFLGE